jgi:prefoldin subunit 5
LGNTPLVQSINKLARGAQYAVEFSNQKVSDAVKGFSTVQPGSTVTVSRGSVDDAVRAIIGNDKVTTPDYSGVSVNNVEGSATALLEAQLFQVTQEISSTQSAIATLDTTIAETGQRQAAVALSQRRADLYQILEDLRAQQADIRNQLFI